jgi:hypothetical protein
MKKDSATSAPSRRFLTRRRHQPRFQTRVDADKAESTKTLR